MGSMSGGGFQAMPAPVSSSNNGMPAYQTRRNEGFIRQSGETYDQGAYY